MGDKMTVATSGTIKVVVYVVACMMLVSAVGAASMDEEMTLLKDKLSKQLVAKGRKKVAALDFTDLQGRKNELGRYLAEQLTIELVSAEGIAVVDRANLKSILDEHKLTEEGLVNPENAKKLGQFAGVDAIILGSISSLETQIVLQVKAVSTETAEVVAAGTCKFAKSSELQQLLAKSITAGGSPTAPDKGSSGPTAQDASAIGVKEVGPLRITIKGVTPLATQNPLAQRDSIGGALFSLELTNTDLQKTLYVAQQQTAGSYANEFKAIATAITHSGKTWPAVSFKGLPSVHTSGAASTIIACITNGKCVDRTERDRGGEWAGAFVAIPPGESVRASVAFEARFTAGDEVTRLDSLQVEAQWILGIAENDTAKPKYKLLTIVFDKIVMPEAGGGAPPTKK